jgi:hypothetical protein
VQRLVAVDADKTFVYRVDHDIHGFKRQSAEQDVLGVRKD